MIYIILALLVLCPPATVHGAPETLVGRVRFSFYDPSRLGTNCGHAVNGVCVSRMASGHRWQSHIAAGDSGACPSAHPFWTVYIIDGQRLTCLDRGGAIVTQRNGVERFDVLAWRPSRWEGRTVKAWIGIGQRASARAKRWAVRYERVEREGERR